MIAWATVGRFILQALEPPDPTSPIERAKRAWGTIQEAGEAAELVNWTLTQTTPLDSDNEEKEK